MIAQHQPSTWRDPVRDVDELVRKQTIEVVEHARSQDFRVEFRHSVHSIAERDAQIRHPYLLRLRFLEDAHGSAQVGFVGVALMDLFHQAIVQLVDQFQVAWQQSPEQIDVPHLQRLRENGVVGVVHAERGDVQCVLERHSLLIDEDAQQFGDGDRRMRVVQLKSVLSLTPWVIDT